MSMNFDRFHATQVEESHNHALFFECRRRHFSIKNTTATRPRHKHSTGSTVSPLGFAQPIEQPRLLQQLSRFYLLPFQRKNLGYLRTWTHHVNESKFWYAFLTQSAKIKAGLFCVSVCFIVWGFLTKMTAVLISPVFTTRPTHLIHHTHHDTLNVTVMSAFPLPKRKSLCSPSTFTQTL